MEAFERLYSDVGPDNYVWYQFRLVITAKSIYDAAGVEGLRRLYKTSATHEAGLTDSQLAEVLEERVHPVATHLMRMWPE